eukprot:5467665-Karenia_brevis.AAC.1
MVAIVCAGKHGHEKASCTAHRPPRSWKSHHQAQGPRAQGQMTARHSLSGFLNKCGTGDVVIKKFHITQSGE